MVKNHGKKYLKAISEHNNYVYLSPIVHVRVPNVHVWIPKESGDNLVSIAFSQKLDWIHTFRRFRT